jgi:hypothetical protein
VIPTGGAHTGAGGASHSDYRGLVAIGSVALAGAVLAIILAIRRRRSLS